MALIKNNIIIIIFGTGKIDLLSFEKWVKRFKMLISAKKWKNTVFGGLIHLVRQNIVVIGGQNK